MSIIVPANTLASGGYEVDNSLRFNDASSDHLLIAPSGAGNLKTWTWSAWVKRGQLGTRQLLFSGYDQAAGLGESIEFTDADKLEYDLDIAGTDNTVTSAMVFRDTSAWYNIIFVKDLTQGTETNRIKVFVNGVQISLVEAANGYPGQNATSGLINAAGNYEHHIGTLNSAAEFFDGYMSEVVFIDGTANDEEDFGEFDSDSGIWKPIKVSGLTFGDNGYYLEFKQSGTSQNSSGLGADTSGEDNHFAVASLTAVDQSTDTCTNNFCTPNSLYPQSGGGIAFSEGNLKTVYTSYAQSPNGTIGAGAGKWYYEVKMGGTHARFGWCESHCPQGDLDSSSTFPAYAVYSNGSNGLRVYKNVTNRSYSDNSGYTSFSSGKTLGIAFDIDNGKLYAHLNGTYYNSGDPAGGSGALITGITAQEGGLFLPYLNCGTNSSRTFEFNFGSPPYAISSSNADGDGYGNFEYAVPSGFFSINTKNLSENG